MLFRSTLRVITALVLSELEQVLPATSRGLISPESSLSAAGIDESRLADAIVRLEAHYFMRFRAEWLADVRTCGDLIDCVARRMFDAVDRRDAVAGSADEPPRHALRPEASSGPQPESVPSPSSTTPLHDSFPEVVALEERLDGLRRQGLENPFRLANESVVGRTARIAGRDVVNFTSFDYLGLASHPDVIHAAKQAIDRFGTSGSASRMVGGNTTLHDALDEELARFLGVERAVVFPCGYGTNASVFAHLFGKGDLILYDELSHNSIAQGATASAAARRSFRHNDHEQLDGLLRDLRGRYRRVEIGRAHV